MLHSLQNSDGVLIEVKSQRLFQSKHQQSVQSDGALHNTTSLAMNSTLHFSGLVPYNIDNCDRNVTRTTCLSG